ncbi:methyl-accepting chemotaxis protein [Pseudovibrio ascidiaceicola]|uniref:Methyl-accepting chemotaxis protein n=1 Tax=Pseudovibrio ascidiaceicola TaxID=285279 RepID=A0A1I3Z1E9_9HYPH|nr:methyl-accepting chemotaxis protein [Pseudovibrio ascidiaceicola]SFK37890.1 methyl-accepting chemotaxis protein [Pseudovibrio ascidiaceicola]
MSAAVGFEEEVGQSDMGSTSWPITLGWVLALLSFGMSWAGDTGTMSILSGSAFLLAAIPTALWLKDKESGAAALASGICLAILAAVASSAATLGGYAEGWQMDFNILFFAPLVVLGSSRNGGALGSFLAISAVYLLGSLFVLPDFLVSDQSTMSGNLIILVLLTGVTMAFLSGQGDAEGSNSTDSTVSSQDAAVAAEVAENEQKIAEQSERIVFFEKHISGLRDVVDGQLKSLSQNTHSIVSASKGLENATHKCSGHTTEVVSSSDSASGNVQTVSAASEELSSSISEIARQIAQANEMVEAATRGAQETNDTIGSLAEAASRIGEVVTLIQAIAEQTNLLALNATIEAARAGEAGKGFAVVAAEVKELANQTSKATEEIASQVSAIQGRTREAVEAIGSISLTMDDVNAHTGAIAEAITQQGDATNEISANIAAAADGTMAVSQSIASLSEAMNEATGSVFEVTEKASKVDGDLNEVHDTLERFFHDVA